ncbi:MAG: gamma-glutamyl-gamma-aminobutyrate hydrolase family protein [Anaerocolumna sp.]
MKKPIIGVTPHYDGDNNRICIASNYLNAVREAGGAPILLPLEIDKLSLQRITEICDGFMFTGGPDITPFRFGEETIQQCGEIMPKRDTMEEELFHIAMESQKPILGICRGIQILNVFLGGTLYQDISTQYPTNHNLSHSQKSARNVLTHSVTIKEDTLLHDILQKDYILVNSFHHQAVKNVAPSLKVAGTSQDAMVEALYMPDHKYFLAVQWHPEHLIYDNEDARLLFKSFIDASMN